MKRDLTISSIVRRYRKMHPIKYIKLSTGDDIVAQVDMKTIKNGELIVINPQKVSIIEQIGVLSMALVKWLPWEDGQRIPINKRHIITVSNCQPVMYDYYHKTEARIKNFKKTGDPQDEKAVAITGQVIEDQPPKKMNEEVAKTAAKLRKMFKETVEEEEQSKLDELMDELDDKDKNTIH